MDKFLLATIFLVSVSTTVEAKTPDERRTAIAQAQQQCTVAQLSIGIGSADSTITKKRALNRARACLQYVLNGQITVPDPAYQDQPAGWSLLFNDPAMESVQFIGTTSLGESLPAMSTLITGLADFLLEQGELELQIEIARRIQKRLCASNQPSADAFPKTCDVIASMVELQVPVAGYEALLRDAAKTDLKQYAHHLVARQLCGEPIHQDCNNVIENIRETMRFVSWIRDQSAKGVSAVQMISALGTPLSTFSNSSLYKEVIKSKIALSELQEELTASTAKGYAHLLPQLQKLVNLRIAIEYELISVAEAVDAADRKVKQLAYRIETVALLINSFVEDAQLQTLARSAVEVITTQIQEEYTQTVSSVRTLVLETLRSAVRQYAEDAANALVAKITKSLNAEQRLNLLPALSVLARAKTADDVRQGLQAITGGPGGHRCKDQGDCDWTLTGYLGLQAGVENSDVEKGVFTYGLYAPLGLHYTGSAVRKISRTMGIYLQLMDLSAIASVRESDDDTEINTTFSQVFAPGIYATFKPRNSAITGGIGIARVPDLVRQPGGGDEEATICRIFLAVDITVWDF